MKINGYENLNFVKWAGGKGHLIPQIEPHLPSKIDRYFEPFIGGGALFFYIMQKYRPSFAFISDINPNLMITYEVIRDDVEGLIQQLHIHKENHRKDFEKFGHQKAIQLGLRPIKALNKKAQKIQEEWKHQKALGGPSKVQFHQIRKKFKEIQKKKEKRINKDIIIFKEKFIIKI